MSQLTPIWKQIEPSAVLLLLPAFNLNACEFIVIAKKLRRCLVVSAFLHILLFIVVTSMSPKTPIAMRAIDAFVVESTVARLSEPKRSPPPKIGRNIHIRNEKSSQPQPVHQSGRTSSHLVSQNADKEATPPTNTPDLTAQQQPQSTDRAAVVQNSAATGPLPDRPLVESLERITPVPSGQEPGREKVMLLGDAGSPRFIHRELPVYPFMARKFGKEGKVLLRLALDAQGKLLGIDTVEANGFGFTEAARSAIRKSTFAPAVRNGKAVPSQVLVSVKFVLQ
jgi:periplasmic protein TonB